MQKRTREIIALVMLLVLAVAGIGGMAWYMRVGHNWNETASNIDDRIGAMEGYTVVLFEGTAANVSAVVRDDSTDRQERDASATSADPKAKPPAAARMVSSENPHIITLPQAAKSYVEKDAQTVAVDITNKDVYADPIIVPRNGKRIAVFWAGGPRPEFAARIAVKRLRAYDIDVFVCIVDDMKAIERGLGDVDIAICTDPEVLADGAHVGRTYTVGVPRIGEVGAVLIAPSGFLSYKVLSSV